MIWTTYNHPKFYDWYMHRLAGWIEVYRERDFIQVADKCITDNVVLDIGCGTGANCILLGKNYPNARIIGIDTNPLFLRRAEQKIADLGIDNVQLVEQDITKCNREDIIQDPIDVAICSLGLSVISDWEKAADQTFSILSPGGHFIVLDLNIDTQEFAGKLSNYLATLFFRAHHDRMILEKLREAFTEIDTVKIDVKPESKTALFIFHGQK